MESKSLFEPIEDREAMHSSSPSSPPLLLIIMCGVVSIMNVSHSAYSAYLRVAHLTSPIKFWTFHRRTTVVPRLFSLDEFAVPLTPPLLQLIITPQSPLRKRCNYCVVSGGPRPVIKSHLPRQIVPFPPLPHPLPFHHRLRIRFLVPRRQIKEFCCSMCRPLQDYATSTDFQKNVSLLALEDCHRLFISKGDFVALAWILPRAGTVGLPVYTAPGMEGSDVKRLLRAMGEVKRAAPRFPNWSRVVDAIYGGLLPAMCGGDADMLEDYRNFFAKVLAELCHLKESHWPILLSYIEEVRRRAMASGPTHRLFATVKAIHWEI